MSNISDFPQKTKPATGLFVQRASGDKVQHTGVLADSKRSGPNAPRPGVVVTKTVNQPAARKVTL